MQIRQSVIFFPPITGKIAYFKVEGLLAVYIPCREIACRKMVEIHGVISA